MMAKIKKAQSEITIRSSAAEYLKYVASSGGNPQSTEMRYEGENYIEQLLAVPEKGKVE